MRLYELFEAPFTKPGVNYVLNSPSISRVIDYLPNNKGEQIPDETEAYGPTGAITTQGAGNNPPSNVAVAAARQQLTKGTTISLPFGPTKQKTPLKITNVSTNDGANNNKTVTVANPQNNPNQPEQTYQYDELANVIAQQKEEQK